MIDGLHIHIQNRTMKIPAIALNGAGRELRGKGSRDGGGNLNKSNQSAK
jgi:hypothetical protein